MSKRILVVENQKDDRQIIRDVLADTDYEITEAEDGEQACGEEQKARAAGCDDFMPKPYSPHQLLAKIRNYLH